MWREVQLYKAVSQVRSVARNLSSAQTTGEFGRTCLEYGGSPANNQSLTRAQIRFVSDKDYILEIVCQTNESLREVIKEGSLPLLVTKGVNQSGLISNQQQHGLTLSILGRTGVVYEGDSFIQSSTRYRADDELILDRGPTTVCAGYGFICCNETYQLGQNQQNTQAWDCPKSCYESCIDKPVILNFYSEPYFATRTRIVRTQSGESIEFFYTVNDIQGDLLTRQLADQEEWSDLNWPARLLRLVENFLNQKPTADSLAKVVITFGDGEAAELSDLQGSVVHTYTCNQRLCVYNAVVQAVTQNEITSSLDQNSNIQIQVQGQ
ncbi:MAG: hypothetical protein ABII10_00115 [Candidatus Paceibacterota bacterium]